MKIHEYQAKQILAEFGVAVPKGRVATTPEDAETIARDLGGRVVVKAQIHAGGRGKGEASSWRTPLRPQNRRLTRLSACSWSPIRPVLRDNEFKSVLVEEQMQIERELYLAVLVDGQQDGR